MLQLRRLVSITFVPLLLAVTAATWAFRAEAQALLQRSGLRLDVASAVLLALITCVLLLERLVPANTTWVPKPLTDGPGGLWRDLLYLFVITQFSALFIAVASGWLGPALTGKIPPLWPANAPFLLKVTLAFFLVELCSYWLHRAAHRVPLLWQFHSTHHVITQLSGLKALRTHPVENVLFYLARTGPLLVLGAGPEEVLAATTLGALLGIVSHANLDLSERGTGLVINLPSYHAVHHSSVRGESEHNFGCHTIFWDRVFGTFRRAALQPLQVGVHPVGTRTLWQELIEPFYRKVR